MPAYLRFEFLAIDGCTVQVEILPSKAQIMTRPETVLENLTLSNRSISDLILQYPKQGKVESNYLEDKSGASKGALHHYQFNICYEINNDNNSAYIR